MRLAEDIDQETFTRKHTETRDQLASIMLQLDVMDRSHNETAELAEKSFLNFGKHFRSNGLPLITRRILEIVF